MGNCKQSSCEWLKKALFTSLQYCYQEALSNKAKHVDHLLLPEYQWKPTLDQSEKSSRLGGVFYALVLNAELFYIV